LKLLPGIAVCTGLPWNAIADTPPPPGDWADGRMRIGIALLVFLLAALYIYTWLTGDPPPSGPNEPPE